MHFAYRSDREPAIVALIQDACAMAGRNGVKVLAVDDEAPDPEVDKTQVAVPEHSHPGESQSNGVGRASHERGHRPSEDSQSVTRTSSEGATAE